MINYKFIFLIVLLVTLPEFVLSQKKQQPDTSSIPQNLLVVDGVKQVDLVDYFVKIFKIKNSEEKRDGKKVRFSIFPTSSNMSGGKTVFTSFNMAFLLGPVKNTYLSTIYFVPYFSTNQRYGFQVQSNIWSSENKWNFVGEYFLLNYPQRTWGVGGNSPDSNETWIEYNYLRFYQNVLRKIAPKFFVGLGYAYDYHFNIEVEKNQWSENIADSTSFPHTTTSSGIVIPVVYGDRRNILNPQGGFMCNIRYHIYLPALGSDSHWEALFVDFRKYFPLNLKRQRIVALRSYYWTVVDGKPPYLDYPSNRWEPMSGLSSRGMTQNRYRSNALLYFEGEYRFGITKNGLFGGVVFANIISASQFNTQNFIYWKPAAGAGLRLKFNKFSRTNVAFDYGFSKDYHAVYLNIGETF